jgi:hypothetical protein
MQEGDLPFHEPITGRPEADKHLVGDGDMP